jgi:hypothetical protein
VRKPQVIEDQEHERVFDRVAAVDVAKASGMVCRSNIELHGLSWAKRREDTR